MKNIKNNIMSYITQGDFINAKAISFDDLSAKNFYNLIQNPLLSTHLFAFYL